MSRYVLLAVSSSLLETNRLLFNNCDYLPIAESPMTCGVQTGVIATGVLAIYLSEIGVEEWAVVPWPLVTTSIECGLLIILGVWRVL